MGKPRLLTKGLEEEVYSGTGDGQVLPLSHRVAADLCGFATEPDARNVEYTTAPYRDYDVLIHRLLSKRCRLRRYLAEIGPYSLIPGGTLSLEESDQFHLSNNRNPYYAFIRDTYGTSVVTASTHINIGIEDPEELIRAYRIIRCEAALFLALTASSPFLAGKATGYHSTRWHVFPKTPERVPFFTSHAHFIAWAEAQLRSGTMQNPRHLWLAVRPNGPDSPFELSRLELRICDRISDPNLVNAVTALFEARVWEILEDSSLDPLHGANEDDLLRLAARNEDAAARDSLDAELVDWRTGRTLRARDFIEETYERVLPLAKDHGFALYLSPIPTRLEDGNLAMRWLEAHRSGRSPQAIIAAAIDELAAQDHDFDPDCPDLTFAAVSE